jgi:hypothetical protein
MGQQMGVRQSADTETSELTMTEQQQQNVIAFLELARTAIDSAELRLVGDTGFDRSELALLKSVGELYAAASNLYKAGMMIRRYIKSMRERREDASAVDRPAAGKSVVS